MPRNRLIREKYGSAALDRDIRIKLAFYIYGHPGVRYSAIKDDLKFNNGVLEYELGVLEGAGVVKCEAEGRKRHCYIARPFEKLIEEAFTTLPDAIFDIIRNEERGISSFQISKILGITSMTTTRHLGIMLKAKKVECVCGKYFAISQQGSHI